MNKFISEFGERVLDLLFNNILTQSTLVGVIWVYVRLYHPEYLKEYETAVTSWLIFKRG
jgi:hypothetical protein